MQTRFPVMNEISAEKPWYSHRWPWLLMLGPVLVIVAGIHTAWLAFSQQDALVIDDYYKQGKAINQDLRRDRAAANLKLALQMRYDAATGKLAGSVYSLGQPQSGKMTLKLIHSTQPEKDMQFDIQTDRQGNFVVALPILEIARWQVLLESERRDWRLNGEWTWPQQRGIGIKAG